MARWTNPSSTVLATIVHVFFLNILDQKIKVPWNSNSLKIESALAWLDDICCQSLKDI